MAATHRFEVRLPEELFDQLAKIAELNNRSMNRELIRAAEVWTGQLRDPGVRAALTVAETKVFRSAFARDWDSEEDSVYDDMDLKMGQSGGFRP